MGTAEQRNIDWGSADVEDATLTVELTGASSKAFKQRFESVHALLDSAHSTWGDSELSQPEGPERDADGGIQDDEAAEGDRQMAAAFRAFAGERQGRPS